jgi:hypothetical protein
LHSIWALLFGIGVMWLGTRHFAYLQLAIFHVAFIWIASLIARWLLVHPQGQSPWRKRIRGVLNYVNKNFYQQILFFLLPIYYLSTTFWSANSLFLLVLAVSAVLSTLDVVYDQHVARRRLIGGVFFGFNLFVTINVMLQASWAVVSVTALRASGLLALVAFVTIYFGRHRPHGLREAILASLIVALLLGALVEWGRPFIPPAPVRLASGAFGVGIDSETRQLTGVFNTLPDIAGPIYVRTEIIAPLGLKDHIRHRWFRDDEMFYLSPAYPVTGGREEGYRLWTYASPGRGVHRLRVDVETQSGQILGRVRLSLVAAKRRPN